MSEECAETHRVSYRKNDANRHAKTKKIRDAMRTIALEENVTAGEESKPTKCWHCKDSTVSKDTQARKPGSGENQRSPKTEPKQHRLKKAPEERREYEKSPQQTPERQEYKRQYERGRKLAAKATGRCTGCPKPAIPGQTRCRLCVEKHLVGNRKKRNENELAPAKRQTQEVRHQPGLFLCQIPNEPCLINPLPARQRTGNHGRHLQKVTSERLNIQGLPWQETTTLL